MRSDRCPSMDFTRSIPPNRSGFRATALAIIVAFVCRRPWNVGWNAPSAYSATVSGRSFRRISSFVQDAPNPDGVHGCPREFVSNGRLGSTMAALRRCARSVSMIASTTGCSGTGICRANSPAVQCHFDFRPFPAQRSAGQTRSSRARGAAAGPSPRGSSLCGPCCCACVPVC